MRRLWRVLEIVLVVGTFAGASALGTLAVLGQSGPDGRSEGDLPSDPGLRTAGEIKACLTGNGLELITADFPTPADATVVSANQPNGDLVLILVFQTASSAAGFREAFEGLQPPGSLVLELDNVLLAYEAPPGAQARVDVEGCILGEQFAPPPQAEEPAGPAGPVVACLTEGGFEVEDIPDVHELPVTSLRVTRAGDLVFVFLFDSEAKADEFQEVYGPEQVVHDLGLAVVEYEAEPAPPLAATIEGCVEPADI